MSKKRSLYGSHSDTSAILKKNMISDLFYQMRESSPSANSPRGSNTSLNMVMKNVSFQSGGSNEHLPWNSNSSLSLTKNCGVNLTSEGPLIRSVSNASALTSLCADLSPSDSHFFEVLYIGKVKISQRKVPDSLIDDALVKFAQHEAEKAKNLLARRNSLISSIGSNDSSSLRLDFNDNKIDLSKTRQNLTLADNQTKEIEDEFDSFTKERVNKYTNNNLHTLNEDEERIHDSCNKNYATSESAKSKNTDVQNNHNYKAKESTIISDNITEDRNSEELKSTDEFVELFIKEDFEQPNLRVEEETIKPKVFLRSKTGLDTSQLKRNSMPENKPFLRDRSASIGTLNLKTPVTQVIDQNRTMLFQIARSELRLISPDRKQILLHRAFKDVASCVLGRNNKEHFGFVCRENVNDNYACYVFKCEAHDVALEVVNAIKQAFAAHAEVLKRSREKSPNLTCEHCPVLWYHRLCHDIEGMNQKKTHAFILRRIEQLPDDEQEQIFTKYQGGTNHMYEVTEHNAFLMMLLRAHCEAKQLRHVHDTAENRSEFLNQYLGGSAIFMKAKRSLSSGFDHLLKRKSSREDINVPNSMKKETSPLPSPVLPEPPDILVVPDVRSKSLSPGPNNNNNNDSPPPPSINLLPTTLEEDETKDTDSQNDKSQMIDIFLKVSDTRPSPAASESNTVQDSTWRHAIYQQVSKPDLQKGELSSSNLTELGYEGKKSKEHYRQLWKMAIEQTILLVRMERENVRLREKEATSAVRRIKLEYVELGVCDAGATSMWDSLLANRESQFAKVDHHMLTQAVMQGVPRMCRGGIWYFLAEQACMRLPPPDIKQCPLYNTPYRALLTGLTKHQHAILIDLGRTFPQHSYFSSALGPGQLSLYNILKAYSLLDPEVGYCQGLSFIAGTLLLHMDENEAFTLFRHLMFRRGLRIQYLPDMSALQIQLYQLSRLIKDHEPELHQKLDSLEISPALYATPWMLTLFTSQFPLGFVVRVFDLIFLQSAEVIFSFSLALLSVHKVGLMLCESCEEAAEYLKHKLPDISKPIFDKVMKKVHMLDISRQLTAYAVEYSVLREEMPRVAALREENEKLLEDKRKMSDELDSAMETITNYQNAQTKQESQNKILEQQLSLLSRFISLSHKELPTDVKKIVQLYNKKSIFGTKIFNKHNEEENKKSGVSAPNLFAKINKDDFINVVNKDKLFDPGTNLFNKHNEEENKKSGVSAPNLFAKINKDDFVNVSNKDKLFDPEKKVIKKALSQSGFTVKNKNGSDIERLFERQLKKNFDENLMRVDAKISLQNYMNDVSLFQGKRSLSLNINSELKSDSGFITPVSPIDDKRDDISVISHPLSDCDIDIKFDGQSTKLKQIRPLRNRGSSENIDVNHS